MSTATTLPQASNEYRLLGRTMIITSSSNPKTRYTVTDRGCDCKGYRFHGHCKHNDQRAAVLAARQPMTDQQYAQVLEACDELC